MWLKINRQFCFSNLLQICHVYEAVEEFSCLELNDIFTPINVEVLEQYLQDTGYDEEKTRFLVQGFQHGFDIGYRGPLD